MASYNFEISFDKSQMNNVMQYYERLTPNIDKVNKQIIEDLSQIAKKEMEKTYNESMSSQKVEPSTKISFTIEDIENGKAVSMVGAQAIYEEFGTGTVGAMNSHENKESKFGLNPYNSGSTIRTNKSENSTATKNGIPVGTLYWTYRGSNNKKIYTQGIKAGMEVYKASKKVRDKLKQVATKRIKEVL